MNRFQWVALVSMISATYAGMSAAEAPRPVPAVPLTLGEAIEQGLATRLTLKIAEADVAKARAAVSEMQGAFLPELSLDAGVTKINSYDEFSGIQATANVAGQAVSIDVKREIPEYNSNVGLKGTLNLYSGGLNKARVAEARGGLNMSLADEQVKRREVIIDIVRAYWSLRKTQTRYLHTVEALSLAQRELAVANTRVEIGKSSKVELEERRLSYVQAQMDKTRAERDFQDAFRRYLVSLGRGGDASTVSLNEQIVPKDDPIDVKTLLQPYFLEQAPELTKVRANVKMAQARRRAVRSEYYAKVDLVARYQEVGRDDASISDAVSDLHKSETSVGIGLSWKLFNGMQTRHKMTQAEQELVRTKLILEQTRQDLAAAAEDRANTIKKLKEDVSLNQDQLAIIREKERIARDSFAAGRISEINYKNAELAVHDAEAKLEIAKIDLVAAVMEYALLHSEDWQNYIEWDEAIGQMGHEQVGPSPRAIP